MFLGWSEALLALAIGLPKIAADVADLRALCRQLGIDTVALVGMSQGARVVLIERVF